MDKEHLKKYLTEAIDALNEEDLEELFPSSLQPDLYSFSEELTSMKGEMKKLSVSSLKLSNDFQQVTTRLLDNDHKQDGKETKTNVDLLHFFQLLANQDILMSRTDEHLKEIPEPAWWSGSNFIKKFYRWKEGFEIAILKWEEFIKKTGIIKSGNPGEIFNPAFHEAVHVVSLNEKPDNIIIECQQPGYLYKQNPLYLPK